MPSIFSRSASTPKKSKLPPTPPISSPERRGATSNSKAGQPFIVGEFGTIPNGGSKTLPNRPSQPLTPPESPDNSPPLLPAKFTFLPTHIPPHTTSSNSVDSFSYTSDDVTGMRQYGFLGGIGPKVVLGLKEVGYILDVLCQELNRRGLITPLLFSNQALELSQTSTKMLIQAYLDTLTSNSRSKQQAFLQDVKFAKEHELAWLLRWTLSRITRMKEGIKEICHGVMEWEAYEEWRGRERAASYPTDAFPFLALILPNEVYNLILTPLFHLLSRFAAHSHLSGLTPHALSSLFAPLLFDVPTSSTAMYSHAIFVRAASATEHLLLAHIRSTSMKGSLGLADLPSRLKEWVNGYPAMVASDSALARGGPRKGARVVRCERATRTVRAYSKDLVSQAESWVNDLPIGEQWDAWERVTWKFRRGELNRPKFTPSYRRRMMVKEHLPLPTSSTSDRPISYGSATKPNTGIGLESRGTEREKRGRLTEDDNEEGRWSSLAGKEWSMFEEGGFDAPSVSATDKKGKGDMKERLQFDLTESAKMGVAERRRTMDWSEFASPSGGFNRTDPHLNASLTFASPIEKEITDWPKERDELRKRLHKSQKESIPFNYDTTPQFGCNAFTNTINKADDKGRVYIEEAFVDCWSDLMLGSSWLDRDELTFREANWALIEYKAQPSKVDLKMQDSDPLGDPRRTELYFLFEESIPPDYQQALSTPAQKKSAFTLFSPKNKKRNQLPVSSENPRSRLANNGWQDEDFDRMLLHLSQTKKVSLTKSGTDQPNTSIWHMTSDLVTPVSPTKPRSRQRTRSGNERRMTENERDPRIGETKRILFGSTSKKDIDSEKEKEIEQFSRKEKRSQKEQNIEYELHSASGISSSEPSPKDGEKPRSEHKNDHDQEKWMDILVANGAKKMTRQDALPALPSKTSHLARVGVGYPMSPHPQPISGQPPSAPLQQISPDELTTPRGSGNGAGPERQRSVRRKALPSDDENDHEQSLEPVSPTSDEFPHTDDTRNHHSSGMSSGISEGDLKILSPIPTRRNRDTKDTIYGIVDHYRIASETDPESELFSEEEGNSPTGYQDYFNSDHHSQRYIPGQGERRRPSVESDRNSSLERFDDVEEDEGGPVPSDKGLIFDLTPGREPSPFRYRHGEPLQFVGEEPEEEDDYNHLRAG
ncbi:uncharacterized protein IL334_006376 [Kwoniella shivajii]|uniref:Meiotically up-regulated protein Msb1/Mug8 domain-containing protein n=1 Tax=Kwoniella shivajii TaxID=564305 RepID=A0ABZ1D704_9TREE|nr:hypothetical protein IL334_006376 [Kwoniella shivajii]